MPIATVSKLPSSKAPPRSMGREEALAGTYVAWGATVATGETIAAVRLESPQIEIAESVDISNGLGAGNQMFVMLEIAFTWSDFITHEMNGARIEEKLRALSATRELPDAQKAITFDRPLHEICRNQSPIIEVLPVEHACAEQDLAEFKEMRLSRICTFIRDGIVQLGKIFTSSAILIKTECAAHGIVVLGHVSIFASEIAGFTLGIFSGLLHFTAGSLDWIRLRKEAKAADTIKQRVESCLSFEGGKFDLVKLARNVGDSKNKQDQYLDLACKMGRSQELRRIENIYTNFAGIAHSAQNTAAVDKQKLMAFSGARISYGIGTTICAILLICGVGHAFIPFLILSLATIWIFLAACKAIDAVIEKKAKALRRNSEVEFIGQLEKMSFNDAEEKFCQNKHFRKSGLVAATILVEHLSGTKIESTVTGRNKRIIGVARVEDCESKNGFQNIDVSGEGLRLRRRTAVRFLLSIGMSRTEVRGLKLAIASKKENLALRRIEDYLTGNAGHMVRS
ncbi:hypothetical protein PQR05_37935 [Paraburkholderia sediminicola]|uniref:hypothetical protein n=1 Tax=Paraburkholderia sediminicola TaxID=458836 RepID=UPI0038B7C669